MPVKLSDDEYFLLLSKLLNESGQGAECAECKYYRDESQSHPYGDGSAIESLWSCVCDESYDCPRVNNLLEDSDETSY